MSLTDWVAEGAYRDGTDPVDYATSATETLIGFHELMRNSPVKDPETFPGYVIPVTRQALARRIVGALLAAGWTPPEVTP